MEVHEVQSASVIEIPEAYDVCALLSCPLHPLLCQRNLAFANPSLGLRISLSASWDYRLLNQL